MDDAAFKVHEVKLGVAAPGSVVFIEMSQHVQAHIFKAYQEQLAKYGALFGVGIVLLAAGVKVARIEEPARVA